MARAKGEFDVKLNPLSAYAPDATAGPPLGRMSIDKNFRGDLEATSVGEMLTAGSAIKGSAVYVAVERVTGTLNGKTGSFALHHTGVMSRGNGELSVVVAPDSGTGELTGLTGEMAIIIADGKHSYEFEYQLP
jgi:LDH2 family malate/lactate/ureidoglycolate dehydrogenase